MPFCGQNSILARLTLNPHLSELAVPYRETFTYSRMYTFAKTIVLRIFTAGMLASVCYVCKHEFITTQKTAWFVAPLWTRYFLERFERAPHYPLYVCSAQHKPSQHPLLGPKEPWSSRLRIMVSSLSIHLTLFLYACNQRFSVPHSTISE